MEQWKHRLIHHQLLVMGGKEKLKIYQQDTLEEREHTMEIITYPRCGLDAAAVITVSQSGEKGSNYIVSSLFIAYIL